MPQSNTRRMWLKAMALCGAAWAASARALVATWQYLAQLTAPAGAIQYGRSIAASGTRGLVGSHQRADLYQRPPTGSILPPHLWLHAQSFAPLPGATGLFGTAVSIDGDRLAIGAPWGDPQLVHNGYVDIYERGASAWVFVQKVQPSAFDIPPPQFPELMFGDCVRLRGDTLVVAARHFGDTAGRVFVFERNGGAFVQTQQLKPSADVKESSFGSDIAITQDTLAIGRGGAGGAGGPPPEPLVAGEVHLYARSNGLWVLQQTITAPDSVPGDRFGARLDLQGHLLAVRSNTKIYTFTRTAGVWSPQWQATLPAGVDGDVVLRPPATRDMAPDLFVGFPYATYRGLTAVGRVLRYCGSEAGNGFEACASLFDPAPSADARFGRSLAGAGHLLVVGAPASPDSTGRARAFERQRSTR